MSSLIPLLLRLDSVSGSAEVTAAFQAVINLKRADQG
ncbi:hypothetical protein SAMN05428971_2714 [Candidatus Pantoea varia]|uniref:Uncharacterized protein n=1 Tax=Candidatus Pantoea varia TaxID=1881036 RepID=A0A1I5E121_9GAMM|nr:hypothetical protein SAMN05428971_2714 [Pantoea varia]